MFVRSVLILALLAYVKCSLLDCDSDYYGDTSSNPSAIKRVTLPAKHWTTYELELDNLCTAGSRPVGSYAKACAHMSLPTVYLVTLRNVVVHRRLLGSGKPTTLTLKVYCD